MRNDYDKAKLRATAVLRFAAGGYFDHLCHHGTVQAAQYRARLESTYRQSLSALAEDLEGIETDLTKSVYANGAATLSDVSRDLSQQANQAKDSLSRLPVEQMNLAGTYKFLSQTGDYATYLSKKVYAGEVVTAKEHENLLRLLQYATKYKNSVTQMVEICNHGRPDH